MRAVYAKHSRTTSPSFPPYRTTSSSPPRRTITPRRASPSQRITSQGVHCLATTLGAREKVAPACTHNPTSYTITRYTFHVRAHLHSRRRGTRMRFTTPSSPSSQRNITSRHTKQALSQPHAGKSTHINAHTTRQAQRHTTRHRTAPPHTTRADHDASSRKCAKVRPPHCLLPPSHHTNTSHHTTRAPP